MNTERRQRIIGEVEAAGWIENGMTVAIGQPTPMALVRQMIRRGLKNLTLVDAGLSLDLLIAAGCARKVVSYYAGGGFGNPLVGPSFRRAAGTRQNRSLGMRGGNPLRGPAGGGAIVAVPAVAWRCRHFAARSQSGLEGLQRPDSRRVR